MTSILHLVQLFNRWSGECQPVRAFATEQAAREFIAAVQDLAAGVEALDHDPARQDLAAESLERWAGVAACDAEDLRVFPVPFSPVV